MKITVQIFTPPRYLLSEQGVTAQHMNLSENLGLRVYGGQMLFNYA
jgi:predicted deacetylase